MDRIAIIAGIDEFERFVGKKGFRHVDIDGVKYIRVAKPSDCMGWRFNSFKVLGEPSIFRINVESCIEEINIRTL